MTKQTFAASAFDGEGARQFGGRWNSKGVAMVYTSQTLAACMLELLVHAEDFSLLENRYSCFEIEFDPKLVMTLEADALPPGWNAPVPIRETAAIGDAWVAAMEKPVLQVPNAVIPREVNFLLNPHHPGFAKLRIGASFSMPVDDRLKR